MDKPKRKPGNQTKYTEAKAKKILSRLASGETLTSICKSMNIPPSTVYQWTVDNRNGFAVDFARARDFGDQVLEDEAVDISDNMEEASETIETDSDKGLSVTVKRGDAVSHRRLRAEIRLKVVARRKGAKIQLNTEGADGNGLASVYEKIREATKK